MKINTTKLVVGVLAVAGVASLVGSISGTVAWFQYNTRTVAEFGGTTTKCSEYLEMRTVLPEIAAAGRVADKNALPNDGMVVGALYLTEDNELYEATSATATKKVKPNQGAAYKLSDGRMYKWDGDSWESITSKYGEWINYLDKNAMKELTGNVGNYKPVTAPGAKSGAVLPTLKANPICGYADYDKWNDAEVNDYMQFTLQFRVLDLDGSTPDESDDAKKDNDKAMLAQDLYITDLTMKDTAVDPKKNVTRALRFHVADASSAAKNQLFGWGDDESVTGAKTTFTTDTHGQLNLGGVDRVANDIGLDVANKYSFDTGDLYSPLNYGVIPAVDTTPAVTDSKQTVNNLNFGNDYIPVNDGKGNLSEGKAIGTTKAHKVTDATLADGDYLTFTFTTWLEGWHEFGTAISGTKTAVKYIGLAPETATDGDKWFNTKDSKVYTYAAATKWGTGEKATEGNYYTTDDGKTGMQFVSGAWKNVNNRIWSDTDFVGSTFNIGISFGVDAL